MIYQAEFNIVMLTAVMEVKQKTEKEMHSHMYVGMSHTSFSWPDLIAFNHDNRASRGYVPSQIHHATC